MTEEIDNASALFNLKRKWQIALRRYVIEKQRVPSYAPYFGLSISMFREWIEIQFKEGMDWGNFGKEWQLDHVVPLSCFDFSNDDDLKLCWNFINIRVQRIGTGSLAKTPELITAKGYYKRLLSSTGYSLCNKMIAKLELLENAEDPAANIQQFISANLNYLEALGTYSSYEFDLLNSGITFSEVQAEKDMLDKFGK